MPAWIHGGADHLVLALKHRADLSTMNYELNAGRALMQTSTCHHHVVHQKTSTVPQPQRLCIRRSTKIQPPAQHLPLSLAICETSIGHTQGKIQIIQGEDMECAQ